MDERVWFIAGWQRLGLSVTELCRRYGVSRKTACKWISRYREEGCMGLEAQSRAPHSNPQSVSDGVGVHRNGVGTEERVTGLSR